ncbi:unnamed protein product [Amoebophrya sp. A120]|nr:unnamed protein product [Amoebophrya sp. A120]|eukprot:GSA120T00006611001.1
MWFGPSCVSGPPCVSFFPLPCFAGFGSCCASPANAAPGRRGGARGLVFFFLLAFPAPVALRMPAPGLKQCAEGSEVRGQSDGSAWRLVNMGRALLLDVHDSAGPEAQRKKEGAYLAGRQTIAAVLSSVPRRAARPSSWPHSGKNGAGGGRWVDVSGPIPLAPCASDN